MPKSEKSLLVISYSFPPDAEVGGRRVARLCRYLPECGISPIVLSVEEEYYARRDLSYSPPPGLDVNRAPVHATLLTRYARLKAAFSASAPRPPAAGLAAGGGGASTADVGQRRGPLRRQLLTLLETPDLQRGWRGPAVRVGRALLQSRRFDAILSSGPPWTTHLVARDLKRRCKLPWMADFRDPWAGLPGGELPRWRRRLDARLEASCVHNADAVICNTETLRQQFMERYHDLPAGNFVTITNGFDDPIPAAAMGSDGGGPLLLHLGSIYAQRRIDTFCSALERLGDSGSLPPGLKVLFDGEGDEFSRVAREQAPRAAAAGAIEFHGRVPWDDAQELLRAASLLLIFQGGFRLQIPAKFFEYLQTGKPIFAVAERGALTDLLESTGTGLWADPSDAGAIAGTLMRALRLPARSPREVERLWGPRFHFRALAGQLARLTRTLTQDQE